MGVISNYPRGLIPLAGLRDMGEVPRNLADTIAPTIDVTEFLLVNRETVTASLSLSSLNSAGLIPIPAGELWYVHQWSVSTDAMAAGETVEFSCGVIQDGTYVATARPNGQTTNGFRSECVSMNPFWAIAGSELSVRCNGITGGGSVNFIGAAFISRFRA